VAELVEGEHDVELSTLVVDALGVAFAQEIGEHVNAPIAGRVLRRPGARPWSSTSATAPGRPQRVDSAVADDALGLPEVVAVCRAARAADRFDWF
jgi:hypothetical protein